MTKVSGPLDIVPDMVPTPDEVARMSREERHSMLLESEATTDVMLADGRMPQEAAWDSYFCLLHECDESGFLEDRPRILSKIDQDKYDPLKSGSPGVADLARERMRAAKGYNKN